MAGHWASSRRSRAKSRAIAVDRDAADSRRALIALLCLTGLLATLLLLTSP